MAVVFKIIERQMYCTLGLQEDKIPWLDFPRNSVISKIKAEIFLTDTMGMVMSPSPSEKIITFMIAYLPKYVKQQTANNSFRVCAYLLRWLQGRLITNDFYKMNLFSYQGLYD